MSASGVTSFARRASAADSDEPLNATAVFFLPVRVLSRLFRRLVLEKLAAAHRAGALQFFGNHLGLTNARAFSAYLAPLRNSEWVVYNDGRIFVGRSRLFCFNIRRTGP
jgi:hypothetical protein